MPSVVMSNVVCRGAVKSFIGSVIWERRHNWGWIISYSSASTKEEKKLIEEPTRIQTKLRKMIDIGWWPIW
jgi:hypothetical protein